MSREHPHPSPASPEPSAARAESCTCCSGGREPDPTDDNLRAVRRLRDLALGVAEKLAARIMDDDAPAAAAPENAPNAPKPHDPLPALVLGFQRAERGVRQSILLSTKLHEDRLARDKQTETVSDNAEHKRRERRKKHVARLAKEAIERGSADEDEEFERLQKLNIRLDEEDIESDLGRLADSALVDRLCKDCGVEAPWDLWDGEHWALEEVLHKPPGSVFAGARRRAAPEAEAAVSEPVEAEPLQPAPVQAAAAVPAANAPEAPGPEPAKTDPNNSFETRMKARLKTALHGGAWLMAVQMDPQLASYIRMRLLDSS